MMPSYDPYNPNFENRRGEMVPSMNTGRVHDADRDLVRFIGDQVRFSTSISGLEGDLDTVQQAAMLGARLAIDALQETGQLPVVTKFGGIDSDSAISHVNRTVSQANMSFEVPPHA